MKKMLKNKKGFTLVELLAVIVILAIIMVIATQQIGKVIAGARADSFVESYQMVAKQIQTYIISDQTVCIPSPTDDCKKTYGLSSDYDLSVSGSGNSYTLKLTAASGGKFANIDLTKYGKTQCTTEIDKVRNGTTTLVGGNPVKERIMDIGTFKNNVCTSNTIEGSVTDR